MQNPLSLIVEDDIKLSQIFSKSLQAANFETKIAHDGQIAMESLEKHTPKVVLLDLHLPQVSGEQILRHLRSQPRFSKTLVVLVTADGNWGESLRQESDLVLIKPVSPLMLRELASRLHLTVTKDA